MEYAAVLDKWDAWRRRMLGFMEPYDAILCPPCALDALPHDATDVPENYPAFTYIFAYNYTGWPGAVVRGGTSATGLLRGVQVVARPWREDVALALARAIERSQGGFRPPADLTWCVGHLGSGNWRHDMRRMDSMSRCTFLNGSVGGSRLLF